MGGRMIRIGLIATVLALASLTAFPRAAVRADGLPSPCSPVQPPTWTSPCVLQISGTVRTAAGIPIAGAAVSDGSNVAQTDANGRYLLQELQFGGYFLDASLPGMNTQFAQVDLTLTSPSATHDFTLLWLSSGSLSPGPYSASVSTASAPVTLTETLLTNAPDAETSSCAYVTDTRTNSSQPMTFQSLTAGGAKWTWSEQLPQGTQEGHFNLISRVVDCASGVQIDIGVTLPYTVDNTPPSMAASRPAAGMTVANRSPVITLRLADDLSGVDPSRVITQIDGRQLPVATVAYNYSCCPYSYETVDLSYATSGLGTGLHTVTVSMADYAGNSATTSWSFGVDPSAPPIQPTFSPGSPAGTISRSDPLISTTATDSAASLDSVTMTLSDGLQTSTLWTQVDRFAGVVTYQVPSYVCCTTTGRPGDAALHDGTYTVTVSAIDANGVKSTTSWQFTVQTLPV